MKHLQIHNSRFITFTDNVLIVDILGGVDLQQIERMVSTLRISYREYPPTRWTGDLYSDQQTDKLIRSLCDKWGLSLPEASKSIHTMITELERYKLERLRYPQQREPDFEPSEEEQKRAKEFLQNPNLLAELTARLNTIGIVGEEENAATLCMAMASHRSPNPFSVICLEKPSVGKSHILQTLSECMPPGSYSFHSRISENSIYYFDNNQINGKALFVEDLEWTAKMVQPLATLQTHGRLTNTRATKNADGMLHSYTSEVNANLCLVACASPDKSIDETHLPFLCLHLNHSHSQDIAVMEYHKKVKAGQIKAEDIRQTQHFLKCALATLQPFTVINPYAPLINLPEAVHQPRISLLLLLNFIETVTYFFQYQRERVTDEETGEVYIQTHPDDIALAFRLLKNNLYRRSDELNVSTRAFYVWLERFLNEAQTDRFTAFDIRKARHIHPRTLNRYLQELKMFSYLRIVGGNRHREGFTYMLTGFGDRGTIQTDMEQSVADTLQRVWDEHTKYTTPKPIASPMEHIEAPAVEPKPSKPKHKQRVRIDEKEVHTLKLLHEMEAKQPGREYIPEDFTSITGRNRTTEARHLKTLSEQGKLNREWRNRQYYYTLATTISEPVGHTPVSDTQTHTVQEIERRTTPIPPVHHEEM